MDTRSYPSAQSFLLLIYKKLSVCVVAIVVASSVVADNPTSSPPLLCDRVPDKPACVSMCGSGSKGPIDLTPLVINGTGATFTNIPDQNGDASYSYNPCYPFNFAGCSNAQVCWVGDMVENIGDGGTEQMMIDAHGTPYLYYTSPNLLDPTAEKSQVYLYCTQDLDPVITFTGNDNPDMVYTFNLSTCHVCPGGCPRNNKFTVPVGYVGTAVLFVLLCSLVGYCVIGAVLVRIRNESNGVLPHQKFWTSSCSLIKYYLQGLEKSLPAVDDIRMGACLPVGQSSILCLRRSREDPIKLFKAKINSDSYT